MNSEGGYHQNAGAVACGGPQKAASAQFTVGAIGFGPAFDDDDDPVQLTHAGWKLVTDGMAESIVRISRELEEAQAQIAVYEAERTILKRERDEAREALDNETQFHHRTHGELVKAQCALMDARAALQRLADCDWVITLPDRMDAVRKIARDALEAAE